MQYLYIYFACLFLFLFPRNVKTVKPIKPKNFVGPQIIPGKFYGRPEFQIFVSKEIFIFVKIHEEKVVNPGIVLLKRKCLESEH